MAKAKRGTAPTRAQQQAARPEYTLSVEQEKQARRERSHIVTYMTSAQKGEKGRHACPLYAGARRKAVGDLRGGGEGNRRSAGGAENGVELAADTDGLQGIQDTPGDLPLYAAEMQLFPLQSPQARDAGDTQGPGVRRRKEGARAYVGAKRQRTWGWRSGTEQGRWARRKGQREHGWMVRRPEDAKKMGIMKGGRWEDNKESRERNERANERPKQEPKATMDNMDDSHRIPATAGRHVARHEACCPIHCTIHGAIHIGTNTCDTHRMHATLGRYIAPGTMFGRREARDTDRRQAGSHATRARDCSIDCALHCARTLQTSQEQDYPIECAIQGAICDSLEGIRKKRDRTTQSRKRKWCTSPLAWLLLFRVLTWLLTPRSRYGRPKRHVKRDNRGKKGGTKA
eukprot:1435689-Pleurochrysis_carterae.AAC.1